jgi:N-acetylmuramoyl-L-alanine amidase
MLLVKKLQYVAAGLAICFIFSFMPARRGTNPIRTIVIDPGHGGKDPGCQGSVHREKDVALAVALKLGKFIEQNMKDVKVIFTRTTDVFVELEDRALIANKAKADLFISIHCNAAGKPVYVTDARTGKKKLKTFRNRKGKIVVAETINPVPFGSETYVMGLKNEEGKMKVATRENSAILLEDDYEKKYAGFDPESEESYIIMSNYTSAYVIQSAGLAMKIQEEYARKAGRIDKGVHRQSIWVLWRTSMPSILTELGYLTNPLEEGFLGSERGQDYLARAIFRGLRKYKDEAEGTKKEYNDEFEAQAALENENLKVGNAPLTKKAEEQEDSVTTTAVQDILNNEPAKPDTKPEPVKVESAKINSVKPLKDSNLNLAPDTVVSAAAIAKKYAGKQPPTPPVKQQTVAVTDGAPKVDVIFKVQFASSDKSLNLSAEKFSVISEADFYRANNVLKYTSGRFSSAKAAHEHQLFLRSKGFLDCFVVAFKNGQRIDVKEAKTILGQ